VPVILGARQRVVAIDEGEGATVSVIQDKFGVRFLKVNSRYTLGASAGAEVHRSQGELALALHGAPRNVAFIGVATGMSVSSILSHPGIEHVEAMELLPGVLRLAQAFRGENGGVLEDPRVRTRLADGRNHLFGSALRFDAIVGDLFVPWHAGTGYLYTVEHFETVRARLAEGGVFAQWLQLDQASPEETRSMAASFLSAFDDAELWFNETQPGWPLVAFVGFRERPPGRALERVARMSRVCGAELLREWSAGAPLNTDDFPFIEFSAAGSHLGATAARTRELVDAVARLGAEDQRRRAAGDGAG
jgi:spermidine synthase